MATAEALTPEQWEEYRQGTRRRIQAEREALVAREHLAWELARQAATLLRAEFQANRVLIFGSLIRPGDFTPWSDVDIAASGIAMKDTLRAMEAVSDLSCEIPVNLVDMAACSASLKAHIEAEGQPL